MSRKAVSAFALHAIMIYLVAFIVIGNSFATTVIDIGAIGGNFGGNKSVASFINNEGDVAGYSYLDTNNYHAFFYSGITQGIYTQGTVYNLGTFGGNLSVPKGLNASGEVSGTAYATGNAPNAFLYNQGVLTNLHTLGGSNANGYGLNDAGTVV